ncbi:hypothetical protein KZ829_19220 [Actinoplanes hulinensis]|uniref:Uncharacterized protein n=1 Tax=Actinoplanes hulinensis TaxID=1144547 RepID=A0ABS7B4I3_9ACTN|nr:hypothetical protein [Actinoplanes hulinensis]MBW6435875.1 hypothetical protein [Actinoplanes hulinensis]
MYFVVRWRGDSPYSKHVHHVPGTTVLGWFQRAWHHEDPETLIDTELDGGAYGFETIFEAIAEHDLPCPATIGELRELLLEHLWVEADDDENFIQLDELSLRVRTDDDEVDLAYYFLDDALVTDAADRIAYLLHDTWPLPADAAAPGTAFTHTVPVRAVGPVAGPDAVFAVRNCWKQIGHRDRNLDLHGAIVFPGVLLPGLATHLTSTDDTAADGWTDDARLIRSLVGPGETDMVPAMRRYAALGGYDLSGPGWAAPDHEQILKWLPETPAAESRTDVSPHLAQVARYIDSFFGHDQLFLFDTRWAAAHPDLARSLLRYAAHWDPLHP